MFVYQPGTTGRRTLFTQPGKEFPVADFMDAAGNPRTFSVEFVNGRAEVSDQLAAYLIDKGEAAKSPIILPAGVIA